MLLNAPATWWEMLICLAVAVVLSTAVGFERQLRSKSAGMRTHCLVGLGAALFVILSKYGFSDVVLVNLVRLDPSRVAAQIVSGIGFIGAGLIFVRRNKVRGLTTAASIWLVAAIGSAAGAGLVVPAVFAVLCHYAVAYAYPWLTRNTALGDRTEHAIRVSYVDGTGALRDIIVVCTKLGFQIQGFTSERQDADRDLLQRALETDVSGRQRTGERIVHVEIELEGLGSVPELLHDLSELENITAVTVEDQAD